MRVSAKGRLAFLTSRLPKEPSVGFAVFGLCAVALIALIVFLLFDALDAWMPNVATAALTIVVTITLVEKLLRADELKQLDVRRKQSLNELGQLINRFAVVV